MVTPAAQLDCFVFTKATATENHAQTYKINGQYTPPDRSRLILILSGCSYFLISLTSNTFSGYQLPNSAEISSSFHKWNTPTCQLNPLPKALVKSWLPLLLPLILSIIHSSLSTCLIPPSSKQQLSFQY